jgi:hypothetical protein
MMRWYNFNYCTGWLLAFSFALSLTQVPAAALPDVTVGAVNGRPAILVGGQPVAMSGYSPMSWDKHYTERAMPRFFPHQLGYYLVSVPPIASDFFGTPFWVGDAVDSQPLIPAGKPSPNAYGSVDEPVELALKGAPDARILIRFGIHEPQSWAKLHPAEFFVAEDGSRQTAPSLASDLYWETAAKFSRAVVTYCEARPWADRVIGYANFHRTEGTHEPAIGGWLYDHSPSMTARWRTFLQTKYGTIDKLQTAWNDKSLTGFDAVGVPTDPLRGSTPEVAKQLYWQEVKTNQRLRDYLELQRDLWQMRFKQISAAMQGGTTRRMVFLHDALKQVMQGWDIAEFFGEETPRSFAGIEVMAASGHMEVAQLFDVPGCDGLITPHDYQARGMGGIFEPEGIADSAVLRGKLFLCEMDTRTYTGRPEAYGAARDRAEFEAITWRNIATGLTRGFWPYWMDLSADWFCDPAMVPVIARQAQVLKDSLQWPHETVPGIAVILDDRAVLETSGAANYLTEAVMGQIRGGLSRCGVPYRVYLLEDLALPNFPKHRVYYFPNLFKADDARMAQLKEKVCKDGNVVVWGPGSGIADGAAGAGRLTGFQFETIKANYPRRTLISNFTHPITRGLPADTVLGSPLAYGPVLFPIDGVVLGKAWTKQGRDLPGLAVQQMDLWTSVFTTTVPLPADLWRNLARLAGEHVYCESNDILLADSSVVALHSLQPGEKTIRLPATSQVTDLVTGELLAKSTTEIRFTLEKPGTRVFLTRPIADKK